MNIEMVFTNEEVKLNIPFEMICQTRYSSIWNTMKRKLLWNQVFTEVEKEKAEKIFRQAYSWYINGIAEYVRIDFEMYRLWDKIARFCCSI